MFKDNERIIKTFLEPLLHTHTKTNNVTRNVESFTKNLNQKTKLNKLFIETGFFGQFLSHFSSLVAKIPITKGPFGLFHPSHLMLSLKP